jgi:hypothetical protein
LQNGQIVALWKTWIKEKEEGQRDEKLQKERVALPMDAQRGEQGDTLAV